MGDALTYQEFNQYISGRGDANIPTLDSLFEDIDEAGLDGDGEPTPHSNDVDEEAGGPQTSQGKDAESSKSKNVSTEMTMDNVLLDARVEEKESDAVRRKDVGDDVGASTSNGVISGASETVNRTVIGEVVGGFNDRIETASQVMEALQDYLLSQMFFTLDENLVGNVENTRVHQAQDVTPEKGFCENVREVYEEFQDSEDDEEVVIEEPCTQIV
ncbi:unnamed protein product [Cuscuta campestris]|uniref:Uncharacterized protein n=1 Tax=Cuscuta campestris TaxID=132261 RepID=A0A484NBU9_9ASTE|nr:unnamed protein product [Cuscuta campestris]